MRTKRIPKAKPLDYDGDKIRADVSRVLDLAEEAARDNLKGACDPRSMMHARHRMRAYRHVKAFLAAAPDLLEALKGLLANAPAPKGIRKDYSYTLYLEAARAAISKAEGVTE